MIPRRKWKEKEGVMEKKKKNHATFLMSSHTYIHIQPFSYHHFFFFFGWLVGWSRVWEILLYSGKKETALIGRVERVGGRWLFFAW